MGIRYVLRYGRMCRNLGIEISREYTKEPHSFRRNGITRVCNASGGNMYLASQLFGNSPQSASRHYYTGIDVNQAKNVLDRVTRVFTGFAIRTNNRSDKIRS